MARIAVFSPSASPLFCLTAYEKHFWSHCIVTVVSCLCDFAMVYSLLPKCFLMWFRSLHLVMVCRSTFWSFDIVVESSSIIKVSTWSPVSSNSTAISHAEAGSIALELPLQILWQLCSPTFLPCDSATLQNLQSLFFTSLESIFFVSFPITVPTPVILLYALPEPLFCHIISYFMTLPTGDLLWTQGVEEHDGGPNGGGDDLDWKPLSGSAGSRPCRESDKLFVHVGLLMLVFTCSSSDGGVDTFNWESLHGSAALLASGCVATGVTGAVLYGSVEGTIENLQNMEIKKINKTLHEWLYTS